MKELLQQIENEYNQLQNANTEWRRQYETANMRYLECRDHAHKISNRAYGVKRKVVRIEKLLDNKFYDSKDKVKIVREMLEEIKEELNQMYKDKYNAWQDNKSMVQ